jgi:hypothetical protein
VVGRCPPALLLKDNPVRMCGWCYAEISGEGEAILVIHGDGYHPPVWVCADERACWDRQNDYDRRQGVEPVRKHTSWIVVAAVTPEGEVVL